VHLDEAVKADLGGMSLTLRPQDSYSLELGVQQPIFLGGQAYYAIEAARVAGRIARLGVFAAQEGVAFAAAAAFFDATFAKENVSVSAENLRVAEAHAADVQKRVTQGVATNFDCSAPRSGSLNEGPLDPGREQAARERARPPPDHRHRPLT